MLGTSAGLAAQGIGALTLVERARGADRVVVGQRVFFRPAWQVNEHGDRLIVSAFE